MSVNLYPVFWVTLRIPLLCDTATTTSLTSLMLYNSSLVEYIYIYILVILQTLLSKTTYNWE